MLDARIYRAALLPVLLAIIVVAFSLENRPRAIGTTLVPDAFDARRATATLEDLARRFPERRPGETGDNALARHVADRLRALRLYDVRTVGARGQTIAGDRELQTVVATRAGAPGPGLVIASHRDAATGPGAPAAAAVSGTAAMLELARAVAGGRLRRTVTFVSTSGGSGGSAGMTAAVRALPRPVDAVLVVGDVAGAAARRPFVIPWSGGLGAAPLRLRRTVESAVRAEAGTAPGGARAAGQFARFALPMTATEQGELVRRGIPAVTLQISGEPGPASDVALDSARLSQLGRATLRSLTALDNGPAVERGPDAGLVARRKVVPLWAVRLLVGALLAPVLLMALDGLARLRRRRETFAVWGLWVLACAAPFALTCAAARGLAAAGLIPVAPATPAPAPGVPLDAAAAVTVAALALVAALATLVLRPAIARRPSAVPGAGDPPGPALAAMLVLGLVAGAVWVVNPYSAALLVAPLHLWAAAVSPAVRARLGRVAAPALILVALLPLALAAAAVAAQLGLGPVAFAWTVVLLVAGGGAGVPGWLAASAIAGCAVASLIVALRPVAAQQGTGVPVTTIRGPRGYAGPGSLGGTGSALRR
jgi:hypothetical protein